MNMRFTIKSINTFLLGRIAFCAEKVNALRMVKATALCCTYKYRMIGLYQENIHGGVATRGQVST